MARKGVGLEDVCDRRRLQAALNCRSRAEKSIRHHHHQPSLQLLLHHRYSNFYPITLYFSFLFSLSFFFSFFSFHFCVYRLRIYYLDENVLFKDLPRENSIFFYSANTFSYIHQSVRHRPVQ